MPRFSYRRGSGLPRDTQASRNTSSFAIIDPSRHLAEVGSSALHAVSEFIPAQKKGHEWQGDAFVYNRLVGEVGYLHDTTSKLVARCALQVIEETTDDPDNPTKESKDPRAVRVMKAFVGPIGGQRELKRRAALHYQIAGESLLLGTTMRDKFDVEKGISWEFLSPMEVKFKRVKKGREEITVVMRNSRGATDGEVEVDASASRFYRPDGEFSGLADSPMKRVLPICRQLVVLMEVVDAVAKQRLSAGILFIPEEMSFGPDDETSEEGDLSQDDMDQFMHDLIEHIRAPIEDRTSAASLVPLVMKGPAELGEKIKLIMLSKDLDKTYQDLRAELLQRIAFGLDAPPEVITGKAALNHWSAYSVDNEFIDQHVAPIGEALAEFLTIAYLRPMLVQKEGMSEDEAERFSLLFDPRPLAQRVDEGSTATTGVNLNISSDEAWLKANGMDASDMATPEERKRRMLERCVLANPALMGPALLPLLYPDDAELAAAMEASKPVNAYPEFGPGAPAPDASADPVLRPVAQPEAPAMSEGAITSVDQLVDRLTTAADAALERALEKAGSRAATKLAGTEFRDDFSGVDKRAIYGQLTPDHWAAMKHPDLVGDAWDGFAERAQAWVADWAVNTGSSSYLASEIAKTAVLNLCRDLDDLLQSGVLSTAAVLPSGLRIPSEVVSDALGRAIESRRAG